MFSSVSSSFKLEPFQCSEFNLTLTCVHTWLPPNPPVLCRCSPAAQGRAGQRFGLHHIRCTSTLHCNSAASYHRQAEHLWNLLPCSPCWGYRHTRPRPSFHQGVRDLNSGPFVCTIGTLTHWTFPPALPFLFKWDKQQSPCSTLLSLPSFSTGFPDIEQQPQLPQKSTSCLCHPKQT